MVRSYEPLFSCQGSPRATIKWSKDGTLGKSKKDHGYYKIQKVYVQEPGVEEDRYMVYYQPGDHFFKTDGT
jgi:hypothetical protein